jgi:solute carrier family 25 oxoglutarate transporter 11
MSAPPAPAKKQAPWKGFLSGSLGAMASGAVTHPIDLVKVRMQLYGQGSEASGGSAASKAPLKAPPGMMRTGYLVVKHEGTFGLYKGLSASLMRQASFIGTKFGAYDLLKSAVPKDADGGLSFWKMTLCGLGAGAIGAAVGNPADLAMVRMQADGRLPLELRRNYRHGGEALMRVVREEGRLRALEGMRADGEQGHDRHRVADGGVRQEQSGHLKGVWSQRRAGGADGCVIHRGRRRGAHSRIQLTSRNPGS